MGSLDIWPGLLSLQLFVDNVESQSVTCPLHLCEQVSNFLLGLDLFLEVLSFQKVCQLGVIMCRRNLVKVQKGLKIKIRNWRLHLHC